MAAAIQRYMWNCPPLDVDFDSADDVLMTSLSPVLDTNLYPGIYTDLCRSSMCLAVVPTQYCFHAVFSRPLGIYTKPRPIFIVTK